MAADYREHKAVLDVPRGTGADGFCQAIKAILKLPRVQEVKIDARGKLSYTRFLLPDEEEKPILVDFDSLMPIAVIRNSELSELASHHNAAMAISAMFKAVSADQLHPVAFVGSTNSTLFAWHKETTGIELDKDEVYGLPFFTDRMVEDYMLFIVAAYSRSASLVDARRAYKIVMPSREMPILEKNQ